MTASVLIVDDEPGITGALMARLESVGYQVFHAINGLAGVEAAAIHHPDAIILDIRMPDIDGFDAYRRIRRINALKNTPIIFLSANSRDEARQQAATLGAAAFLPKPFDAHEVLRTLESVIPNAPTRAQDHDQRHAA